MFLTWFLPLAYDYSHAYEEGFAHKLEVFDFEHSVHFRAEMSMTDKPSLVS